MLTLILTLTLSTIHLPPPSSLHLIEAQADDAFAPQPEATRARLLEIDKELSLISTTWPTGSVVLMAVGFGGAATLSLVGFVIGIALSGLPGVFILVIGLVSGGLALMLGIAGAIWGAAQAGADRERMERLEEEKQALLRARQADGRPQLACPPLITLATF